MTPDSFTHGSSAERQRWLSTGLRLRRSVRLQHFQLVTPELEMIDQPPHRRQSRSRPNSGQRRGARAAGAAKHTLGRLVSISIGEHKEVAVYVRGQASAAKKVGIPFEDQTWPSTLTQDECKARLRAMNDDESVLGVILQRPIPKHIHGRSLASAIHPLKDIEGMNPASIGDIVYNDLRSRRARPRRRSSSSKRRA